MSPLDAMRFCTGAVIGHRLRSALSMIGIAVGIAAVILLTSIGEGARQFVLAQFTQFGTNLLAVTPGKTETIGLPGAFSGTTHKLTLDDAEAIRRVQGVENVVPMAFALGSVEANGKNRSVYIYGVNAEVPEVWKFRVLLGSFWPRTDPRRGSMVAVLGPGLKRELFGTSPALGRWVRIAGAKLRVIGIMEPKGQMLGIDIDDAAYIPIATAMRLFNLDEVTEIDVSFHHEGLTESVVNGIRSLLTQRHGGREDVTITTQRAMLDVFDQVLRVVTLSVVGIASISLLVGAIGVLTMMWISVGERVHEIGLLRAFGARTSQVQSLFLLESSLLGLVGGALGVVLGTGLCALLRTTIAGFPIQTPAFAIVAALVIAMLSGLAAGYFPARRASRLLPIEALRMN